MSQDALDFLRWARMVAETGEPIGEAAERGLCELESSVPAGVEQFYTPPHWRVTVELEGVGTLARYHPMQGHHLAAAARALLELYVGADHHFGLLDPHNRRPITVRIEPLD